MANSELLIVGAYQLTVFNCSLPAKMPPVMDVTVAGMVISVMPVLAKARYALLRSSDFSVQSTSTSCARLVQSEKAQALICVTVFMPLSSVRDAHL